MRFWIR